MSPRDCKVWHIYANSAAPVIIVSGTVDQIAAETARAAGAVEVPSRPFDMNVRRNLIAQGRARRPTERNFSTDGTDREAAPATLHP